MKVGCNKGTFHALFEDSGIHKWRHQNMTFEHEYTVTCKEGERMNEGIQGKEHRMRGIDITVYDCTEMSTVCYSFSTIAILCPTDVEFIWQCSLCLSHNCEDSYETVLAKINHVWSDVKNYDSLLALFKLLIFHFTPSRHTKAVMLVFYWQSSMEKKTVCLESSYSVLINVSFYKQICLFKTFIILNNTVSTQACPDHK